MKIKAKVAKVLKRIRNKLCVSVVQKINNRYFYTTQIFNNLSKFRIRSKKTQKRQPSKNISSIKSCLESQLLKYLFLNKTQAMNYLQPFLVTDAQLPNIVMPQQLEVALHQGQEIGYQDNVQYHRIKTQQLMESMKQKNSKDLKLNFSVPQMELKSQQYQTTALVSKFFHQLHKVNLWMYFGKRFTDWHYDGHDNFLYVLQGRKYVYMTYHINIKSKNVYSLFNNHSQHVDQEKIPIIEAVVEKGKCLFIPKGWWHKVVTQGAPSIAVNFWGNSISKTIQSFTQIQKTLVLKSLLFDVATDCCKNFIPEWQNLQQKQMEEMRRMMGRQILELL